jgi:pimeloyl-ACP methyl ester carboxylesterase
MESGGGAAAAGGPRAGGGSQAGAGGGGGAISCDPVVILGGFFSTRRDYWEMQPALEKLTGQKVVVVPTTRFDWLLSLRPIGWSRILKKLDRTVRRTLRKTGAAKVVLVGHSTGGVMARLYLSPEPFRGRTYAGVEVVRALVTLGSPHRNDGGSGMRRWVDETFPGARFAPAVRYMTVAGKSLLGDRNGKAKARAAYRSYRLLCGKGDVWGDGIVPVCAAHLDGAAAIDLDGVFHSPKRGRPWYGNTGVVRRWWEAARGCLSEPSS